MTQTLTWPELLSRVINGADLAQEETAWVMDRVMSGEASPAQLGALLVGLRAKGETVEEMTGLAQMMLRHARRFQVEGPSLDIVGTGGDRAQTVNISTMACLVAAASGVSVVKHGNRAASSRAGSADMIEALGIRLDLEPDEVEATLHRCGLTFCFAQTFHPSMRHAGAVRRDLGIPTAFNFLGPLTNPAQPRYAAVGVADERMAPLMAGVFAARGASAVVFRGDDGLDEVTTGTSTTVWWVQDGTVRTLSLHPEAVGLPVHPVAELRGGDAEHNAAVCRSVLAGETGAVRDAVLLNAGTALALVAAGEGGAAPEDPDALAAQVRAGVERAAAAIDSGAATQVVQRWMQATQASGSA